MKHLTPHVEAGALASQAHKFLQLPQTHLLAEQVLLDMVATRFKQGDFDSDECIALTLALTVLKDRIAERGYRA